MSKTAIRAFLLEVKPFIKISYFAGEVGIPKSSLSRFMQDDLFAYMVSIEKLELLYKLIMEKFEHYA